MVSFSILMGTGGVSVCRVWGAVQVQRVLDFGDLMGAKGRVEEGVGEVGAFGFRVVGRRRGFR